jgi:hypothetical protein
MLPSKGSFESTRESPVKLCPRNLEYGDPAEFADELARWTEEQIVPFGYRAEGIDSAASTELLVLLRSMVRTDR